MFAVVLTGLAAPIVLAVVLVWWRALLGPARPWTAVAVLSLVAMGASQVVRPIDQIASVPIALVVLIGASFALAAALAGAGASLAVNGDRALGAPLLAAGGAEAFAVAALALDAITIWPAPALPLGAAAVANLRCSLVAIGVLARRFGTSIPPRPAVAVTPRIIAATMPAWRTSPRSARSSRPSTASRI